ncbi:4Fe-4S binding protein [Paracoccus jiaweipingae]|uniref:4Fe-4S binding protein n=1 Tax=unclassified Paracoccus (in: a-proteobacteria) TaxID=2688777 RepID=UPI0037BBDB81
MPANIPTQLLLCRCENTLSPDPAALAAATGLSCGGCHDALCMTGLPRVQQALAAGDTIIACGQEADRFAALAQDLDLPEPLCIDIRDRAGWSDQGAQAGPKMAALLALGQMPAPPVKTRDVTSGGACLLIGAGQMALDAAAQLAGTLAVTLLLTDDTPPPDPLPGQPGIEVIRGRITAATGSLGQFGLRFDRLQIAQRGGRGTPGFTDPRDGAASQCDVIVDLSGAAPLFAAPHKRDGYLRADPGDPAQVAQVLFQAAQHIGTFEKPLHVTLDPALCAHSRAGQTGCSRCLDACPTGAITPACDHVAIDPLICAGCGVCAALCPPSAIRFDAPPQDHLLAQIRLLAQSFTAAGGRDPVLLIHDDHGAQMIALAARHGRGLPADTLPLQVPALSGVSHAVMLAALAAGFAGVAILPAPRSESDQIGFQVTLAQAMGAGQRVTVIDTGDPDALSDRLYDLPRQPVTARPVLAMGASRQVARLAARALLPDDRPVPLPAGAPYGAVRLNRDACTLCLSCAGLCPSGALCDNPERPELRFQEDACLQCGLCAHICPEDAITLVPRLDPSDDALRQQVLNEEEPFPCIECGTPFGVKSTVRRIVTQLAGQHPAFASGPQARMIQMCGDCRVRAQAAMAGPMAQPGKTRTRTTDDYRRDQ